MDWFTSVHKFFVASLGYISGVWRRLDGQPYSCVVFAEMFRAMNFLCSFVPTEPSRKCNVMWEFSHLVRIRIAVEQLGSIHGMYKVVETIACLEMLLAKGRLLAQTLGPTNP